MTTLILTIIAALAILVALLIAGAPVFVGFLAVSVLGVLYYFWAERGFGLFANSIFTTATTDTLAAVPLFIVIGEFLYFGFQHKWRSSQFAS